MIIIRLRCNNYDHISENIKQFHIRMTILCILNLSSSRHNILSFEILSILVNQDKALAKSIESLKLIALNLLVSSFDGIENHFYLRIELTTLTSESCRLHNLSSQFTMVEPYIYHILMSPRRIYKKGVEK